ncbi:hypothetical protein ACFOY2_52380 [Nonomuraea purpurea]|uniref:DUF3592 domain-containing protein n=1 Tax=Nonomuraea purpurea TaxID=1849276 RepID=A0ABV8GQC7_9ACTN
MSRDESFAVVAGIVLCVFLGLAAGVCYAIFIQRGPVLVWLLVVFALVVYGPTAARSVMLTATGRTADCAVTRYDETRSREGGTRFFYELLCDGTPTAYKGAELDVVSEGRTLVTRNMRYQPAGLVSASRSDDYGLVVDAWILGGLLIVAVGPLVLGRRVSPTPDQSQ